MPGHWLRYSPVPGTWSTLEVICHLADSKGLFADRTKRVLTEDQPVLPFADPGRYTTALSYYERDVFEEIAISKSVRHQMTRIFRAQPP